MNPGDKISKNFVLKKRIESLDEFWETINTDKSIYWRFRPNASAFYLSWTIRTIKKSIDLGLFWSIEKIKL
jgi:hypothetical protein